MHLDLLEQARSLALREAGRPRQASLRRAVSAAYYALFHMLSREASRWALPTGLRRLRPRLGRAGTHENARRASVALASGGTIPLLGTITVPPDLRQVAEAVIELQEARQVADYDLEKRLRRAEAIVYVQRAEAAVDTWRSIRDSDAARLYLLLLLVYGNLRDR